MVKLFLYNTRPHGTGAIAGNTGEQKSVYRPGLNLCFRSIGRRCWIPPPPDPDKYMASCGPATWLLTTLNKDRHDTGVRWPCI